MLVGVPRSVRISEVMGGPFPTVSADTPISAVASLLKGSQAVLVVEHGSIKGIISAENLLGSYSP
jgi:predicted transcriptional regulator